MQKLVYVVIAILVNISILNHLAGDIITRDIKVTIVFLSIFLASPALIAGFRNIGMGTYFKKKFMIFQLSFIVTYVSMTFIESSFDFFDFSLTVTLVLYMFVRFLVSICVYNKTTNGVEEGLCR